MACVLHLRVLAMLSSIESGCMPMADLNDGHRQAYKCKGSASAFSATSMDAKTPLGPRGHGENEQTVSATQLDIRNDHQIWPWESSFIQVARIARPPAPRRCSLQVPSEDLANS